MTIGTLCFDPYLLLASLIQQELIRIEDYASDALVLKLASAKTIRKRMDADPDPYDVRNSAVTMLPLLFFHLWLYAFNGTQASWKTHSILYFASLLCIFPSTLLLAP